VYSSATLSDVSRAGLLYVCANAEQRCYAARDFLRALDPQLPVAIMVPNPSAGLKLIASVLAPNSARFAWQRRTLHAWVEELALPKLAAQGVSPVRGLGLEGLCARVVHELHLADRLGRFEALHDRPGFVRALASTLLELRMAGVPAEQLAKHDLALSHCLHEYEQQLMAADLADPTRVFELAQERLLSLPELPALLILDVAAEPGAPARFLRALCRRARQSLVTVAQGDRASLQVYRAGLGEHLREEHAPAGATHELARLQNHLFALAPPELTTLT
jgi:hypothetical protein